MSIDDLLSNPVRTSMYRRSWEERTMDIHNLSRQPDGESLLHQMPDPPVEVTSVTSKPKTEAQKARSRKKWKKLKSKIKAREQQQLEKQQPALILDP